MTQRSRQRRPRRSLCTSLHHLGTMTELLVNEECKEPAEGAGLQSFHWGCLCVLLLAVTAVFISKAVIPVQCAAPIRQYKEARATVCNRGCTTSAAGAVLHCNPRTKNSTIAVFQQWSGDSMEAVSFGKSRAGSNSGAGGRIQSYLARRDLPAFCSPRHGSTTFARWRPPATAPIP